MRSDKQYKNMKICIVTVYDSVNCGSYWQAFMLGKIIEQFGHDVYYLERSRGSKFETELLRAAGWMKNACFGGSKNGDFYRKRVKSFRKAQKIFNTVKIGESKYNQIDCFVLGSDTIWNLDDSFFRRHYAIYWGRKLLPAKIITYAGSVANTPIEKIQTFTHIGEIAKIISQWHAISVRDLNTQRVIQKMTNAPVKLVLDPTLLYDYQKYRTMTQRPLKKRYIFLYLFCSLSDQQLQDIIRFAKSKEMSIVTGTKIHRINADLCEVYSPIDFLNYIYYADYVVTDTFHGTIFSVNFNKEFVVLQRGKNKVNEFLDEIKLKERIISEKPVSQMFSQEIDYKYANSVIDVLRNKSLHYLEDALKP